MPTKKQLSKMREAEKDIEAEARIIAVAWMECGDRGWIGEKHKLASDIMNYARRQSSSLQSRIKELEQENGNLIEAINGIGYHRGQLEIACDKLIQENERLKAQIYTNNL